VGFKFHSTGEFDLLPVFEVENRDACMADHPCSSWHWPNIKNDKWFIQNTHFCANGDWVIIFPGDGIFCAFKPET
jgi:hypothetical protein